MAAPLNWPPPSWRAVLAGLPLPTDPHILVDTSTHDDAGVYQLDEQTAIIHTTDFFPPICSDPYEYGQIAAANALSDVFAMGGRILTALNIVLFPSAKIPLEVLREILRGGIDKVNESGGVVIGGHTIENSSSKYGLAVNGVVSPRRIITNASARAGDRLILSKPIGVGILSAGNRIGMAGESSYRLALETMKQLNRGGASIMQEFGVRAATDITGFGLLGHALKMAKASAVSFNIQSAHVPLLPDAYRLADQGCLPGAAFRNQEYVEGNCFFHPALDYSLKMLLCDAQTSGGLLMSVDQSVAEEVVERLHQAGYPQAALIGEVTPLGEKHLVLL